MPLAGHPSRPFMPNIVRLHPLAHTETNHATSLVVWNPTQARGFATVMDGTHTWWDGLVWEWPDPEIWPAGAELRAASRGLLRGDRCDVSAGVHRGVVEGDSHRGRLLLAG